MIHVRFLVLALLCVGNALGKEPRLSPLTGIELSLLDDKAIAYRHFRKG